MASGNVIVGASLVVGLLLGVVERALVEEQRRSASRSSARRSSAPSTRCRRFASGGRRPPHPLPAALALALRARGMNAETMPYTTRLTASDDTIYASQVLAELGSARARADQPPPPPPTPVLTRRRAARAPRRMLASLRDHVGAWRARSTSASSGTRRSRGPRRQALDPPPLAAHPLRRCLGAVLFYPHVRRRDRPRQRTSPTSPATASTASARSRCASARRRCCASPPPSSPPPSSSPPPRSAPPPPPPPPPSPSAAARRWRRSASAPRGRAAPPRRRDAAAPGQVYEYYMFLWAIFYASYLCRLCAVRCVSGRALPFS